MFDVNDTNDHPGPRWRIRRLSPPDEAALPHLYSAVIGCFDLKHWRWLFRENPSGHGTIWIAETIGKKEIVGQYAVVPTQLIVQGESIPGAQALRLMTHPAYRKQGIFKNLARSVFDDCAEKGIDLVYGFPNPNSTHGHFKYLEFFMLCQPTLYSRPLDFAALLKVKLKKGYLSNLLGLVLNAIYKPLFIWRAAKANPDIEVMCVERFPGEIEKLCRNYNKAFKNMVARSVRYLNWRYSERPDRSYRIYIASKNGEPLGYCVYGHAEREGIKIGLIMDLYADGHDSATLTTLVNHMLHDMEKEKDALAACLLQPKSPMLGTLRKCGFVFPLRRFPPLILRLNTGRLKRCEIDNLDDWHITFGDADFV